MSESSLLHHTHCDACGSSDANAVYDDGHTYCFSCNAYGKADNDGEQRVNTAVRHDDALVLEGEILPLTKRKIKEETCRLWGYRVDAVKMRQNAYYLDLETRQPIACKVRFPDKEFTFKGNPKIAPLYGQWLWPAGGKMLVITEGEIDALSVSEAQDNKWPVVSVQNGAAGASRSIKKALDYVNSFEKVILFFDMDEPGRKAAVECAKLLPPGKAYIAQVSGAKDASDLLQQDRRKDIITAIWQAQPYRPDGIIDGKIITLDRLKKVQSPGYRLMLPAANEMMLGIREREITLLTAGSGIGKSTLAREVAKDLHEQGLTIGNIYLEESVEKTAQGYVAIHHNVPLGKLRQDPSILTDAQWDEALQKVIHERMYFYEHFGSMDSDDLIEKIRYMRTSLGCHFVILDHISIVISGQESSSEGERKDIDRLMTKLRALAEQTGVGIIAIVHLKQPEGKPHEEGGRVTLSQLRGSGSLKQLSDNVVALERDGQGENPNQSRVRILKCRETGETGEADLLEYNRETGRLLPIPGEFEATAAFQIETEF